MIVQQWTDVIAASLQRVWESVVAFVPNLIGAAVVFIVGLIVASGLAMLIERLLMVIRFDKGLQKLGIAQYFERGGFKFRASYFVGQVVYWFIVLVFLLAVSDALGLWGLTQFINNVIAFVPNVIAAALIMLASLVLAHFLRQVVAGSVLSARLHAARFLGTLAWWVVVVFGFFAMLSQLHVAENIVNNLVMGFIAMLALAGGLAFGLGGRDYAAHLLEKLQERTEGRR